MDEAGNWHYIVYMGEKNVNDPTNLSRMGNMDSGSPTLIYWQIAYQGNIVAFPIIENPEVFNSTYDKYENGTDGKRYPTFTTGSKISGPQVNNVYTGDEVKVANGTKQGWPLIRNHVYRMYVNGTRPRNTRGDGQWNISVNGKMSSSRTINFNDRLFKKVKPDLNGDVKPAEAIFRK